MQTHDETTCVSARCASSRYVRAAVLAAVLLATRIPFLNHPQPYHGDELEFTAAIGFPPDYPVHQPGYPLWVALGTATSALGVAPYRAYQLWSAAASVAAPLLLYRGLAFLGKDGLAWWTAVAFGVSPLMWFTSTTALNYPLACAAGLWIAARAFESLPERNGRAALGAAGGLAASMFLRPDLLLWLGPLVGYAAWRAGRRSVVMGAFLIAFALAGYLGVHHFLYERRATPMEGAGIGATARVVFDTSVFRLGVIDGFLRNVVKLAMNVGWHMGVAGLLTVWAFIRLLRTRRDDPVRLRAWLLWTGPLMAFVTVIHMSEPGHLIVMLPALYALLATQLCAVFSARAGARIMAVLAMASALQFAAYPWSAESTGAKGLIDRKIGYVSAAGLMQIDRWRDVNTPGDFWPTKTHRPGPK